jgi:lysyl-tRNA synthetase class II
MMAKIFPLRHKSYVSNYLTRWDQVFEQKTPAYPAYDCISWAAKASQQSSWRGRVKYIRMAGKKLLFLDMVNSELKKLQVVLNAKDFQDFEEIRKRIGLGDIYGNCV